MYKRQDDLLIGLADEVTLPKIKNKTTSVSGMGIAGEVDSPVPGQFESMEATLNWNTMYSYATKMMNPNKNIQITLRAVSYTHLDVYKRQEKWFAEAVARGRINAPGFFDDQAVAKAYMGCTWNGLSLIHIYPLPPGSGSSSGL